MTEFLARLKQRKLVQWALAYIAAAFALIQVIDVVASQFGWPESLRRGITLALAVGFVVTLVIAWYHGEQGRQRVSGTELLLIALVLAIGGTVVWQFGKAGSAIAIRPVAAVAKAATASNASPASAAVTAAFNPPADSLVVLPFANLSGDPKQQYFSDGITEELTDALGQNPALHVIAWDTASKYRNGGDSPTTVGRALNVANLLHGSIARDGGEVRVTAELVNSSNGYQLWSAHYDEPFKNIFAVEDEVSKAIAGALQVKFAQADLPTGTTINPEAHALVLKGRALYDRTDAASLDAARQDFEQAIALDHGYAEAHALLSHTLIRLTEHGDLTLRQARPQIRAEAEKAVALDPHNADAWIALGVTDLNDDPPRIAEAQTEFRKALALDPNSADAHLDYAETLPWGRQTGVVAEFRKALALDPDNVTASDQLSLAFRNLGDWAQMAAEAKVAIRLDPEHADSAFYLAYARKAMHQYDRMAAAFDLVKPATSRERQWVDAGRLVFRAVADPTLHPQALAALKALSGSSLNGDKAYDLTLMTAILGDRATLLQSLESLCPADPVYCGDLAVNPWYDSLHGDPRFEALANRYTAITRADQPAPHSSGALP